MTIKKILLLSSLAYSFSSFTNAEDVVIKFSQDLNKNELESFALRQNLKIKDLYFSSGEIQGGYRLEEGESLNEAMNSLTQKHTEFLRESIQLESNGTNKSLKSLFRENLSYTEKQSLAVNGIKVDESTVELVHLLSSDIVLEIKPEKQLSNNKNASIKLGNRSLSYTTWAPTFGKSKAEQGLIKLSHSIIMI